MTYSSSFQDSMIQLGNTWVRASQIETVGKQYGNQTGTELVTVTLISGRKVSATMKTGGSKDIARSAVGLP